MTDGEGLPDRTAGMPFRPTGRDTLRAGGLFAATIALFLVTVAMLLPEGALISPDPGVLHLIILTPSLLAGASVYVTIVRRAGGWRSFGFQPVEGRWISRAVLVGIATLGIAALAATMLDLPDMPRDFDILLGRRPSVTGFAAELFGLGFVAPLGEEILFRGVIYAWARRRLSVVSAALVSGVLFAVVHVNYPVHGMVFVGIVGFLAALFYERSGSLWPAVALHGTYNGLVLAGLYLVTIFGPVSGQM